MRIKAGLFVLLVVILFSSRSFGYQVLIDGVTKNFEYKRTITIQGTKVPAAQSNFPMLFDSKTDPDDLQLHLKTVGNGGYVRSDDGYDIVFATGDGVEILKHEIEKYVPTSGEYVAWVKVDLTGNNQDIYLYYGSDDATSDTQHKTDVWSNNYREVWHLHESSGNPTDSTSNGYTGTVIGGSRVHQGVSGKINDVVQFDGDLGEARISLSDGTLTANSPFTIEAWFYMESPLQNQWIGLVTKGRESGQDWVGLWVDDSNEFTFGWHHERGGNIHGSTLQAGQWYYGVATYDGTNRDLYLNNNWDGGGIGSHLADITLDARVADDSNLNYLDGFIDEVRISNNVRSTTWIETCYNNQDDPGSFYTVGDAGPTQVELSYFRAKPCNSAVLIEWATETELDNEGFNLWRSEEKDGEYVRINPYFIPAQGEAGLGAEYSYTDYDVRNGKIYYYKLEDINIHGKSTFHGPVSATPHNITLIWPDEGKILPSGALLFSWASSGGFYFKVEISMNPSFAASETLTFPEEGWITTNSLWLRPEEWEMVLKKAYESGGQLFWRVRAKNKDGREIFSDWRRYVIEKPNRLEN